MAQLTLSDGAELSYREAGAGPPLVLLHGWGIPAAAFAPQLRALASHFHVLAPDLRGHGASSPLVEGQGFDTLVDDLGQFLRARAPADAIVVGWSMGGMLAWRLAAAGAGRGLRALVTIDIVPRLLNDEGWRFGLRDGRDAGVYRSTAQRMATDWPGFMGVFVPRILARGRLAQRRQLCDRLIELGRGNDPASMARLWLSMVAQDLRGELPRVPIPCLVVHGVLSQLYDTEAMYWVCDQLPQASLAMFRDSGHAPHLEEPERFREVLLDFVAGTGGGEQVSRVRSGRNDDDQQGG